MLAVCGAFSAGRVATGFIGVRMRRAGRGVCGLAVAMVLVAAAALLRERHALPGSDGQRPLDRDGQGHQNNDQQAG